jgi:hypothetical protein
MKGDAVVWCRRLVVESGAISSADDATIYRRWLIEDGSAPRDTSGAVST